VLPEVLDALTCEEIKIYIPFNTRKCFHESLIKIETLLDYSVQYILSKLKNSLKQKEDYDD